MIVRLPKGFSHPMTIGEGAFSSVIRARQGGLDRWVAIKIVYEKDKTLQSNILSEATTQAKLHLSCVPEIYDVFLWRGRVCIVMQWIRGITLSRLLDAPLTPQQRLWLAEHFIGALAALHDKGFAHRDLKPDNIQVSPDKGIVLMDFGFTKQIIDGMRSVSGTVKGTPAYMAPELWRIDSKSDPMRADLFSAGKILMEILADLPQSSIISNLTFDNPELRPRSAHDFLRMWRETNASHPSQVDWHELIGPYYRKDLSDKLFTAAQELLIANRYDESYWLLVECLEENSGHADALRLMQQFHTSVGKNRAKRRYFFSAAAVLLCFLFLIAYTIGRYSNIRASNSDKTLLQSLSEKPDMIRNNHAVFFSKSLPAFRYVEIRDSSSLSGCIIIKNVPKNDSLVFDGKVSIDTIESLHSFICRFGEHHISVIDRNNRMVWNEKVTIVPFQTKTVFCSMR